MARMTSAARIKTSIPGEDAADTPEHRRGESDKLKAGWRQAGVYGRAELKNQINTVYMNSRLTSDVKTN